MGLPNLKKARSCFIVLVPGSTNKEEKLKILA